MCIKPQNGTSGASEDIVVQKNSFINYRMPKNTQLYSDPNEDQVQVVCKNVGSNSMYFELQGDGVEEIDVVGDEVKVKDEPDGPPQPRMPTRKIRRDKKATIDERNANKGNPGTAAFVSILLHCLKCRSCDQVSCKKMTMVLKHYQSCRNKRLLSSAKTEFGNNSQSCKLCQQLLRIVAHHSKYLCRLPPGKQGCPVLMCDTFRIMSQSGPAFSNPHQIRVRKAVGTQSKA